MTFLVTRFVPLVAPVYWMPQTVVAAAAEFASVWIVFCEITAPTPVPEFRMPMTEAPEVVPVPPAPVRLLIVFDVTFPIAFPDARPINWAVVEVELFRIESAIVPPIVFDVALKATALIGSALNP